VKRAREHIQKHYLAQTYSSIAMADTEPLVNGNGAAHESAYVKDLQKYVHTWKPQLAMQHVLTSAV